MTDPWKNTALRNAQEHPGEEWPPNLGHKYAVRTMDTCFYADEVRLNEMTHYPEWKVNCPGYRLSCKRIENAVIYEYDVDKGICP